MYRWLFLIAVACVGSMLWMNGTVMPDQLVRVGVTSGPHAIIAEFVKTQMAKHGITVQIIEFNDFHLPNASLDAGEIDLNIYQHEPFLKEDCKTRNLKLTIVGKSVLMPMGLYSIKYKKVEDLPSGARVTMPSDPTNRERAKALCVAMGVHDVQFVEVDAPQLPRTLDDVEAALIPTDWVVLSGMDPKQALCHENATNSPYTNVIVGKEGVPLKPSVQNFLVFYQSPETKRFIEEQFHGSLVAGW